MDFKKLREDAGLTLERLAELSGYKASTINGLELNDEGSPRLRQKLREILCKDEGVLREEVPESETELWKRRAKDAEERLEEVRRGLRVLLEVSASGASKGERSANLLIQRMGEKSQKGT